MIFSRRENIAFIFPLHQQTYTLAPLLSPPISILVIFLLFSFLFLSTPSYYNFLHLDNSSVFLRAAVCPPAYCDFHRDSFRDHSHLSWELEPRLWREINHRHLILTRIHKHEHINTNCLTQPPFCFKSLSL